MDAPRLADLIAVVRERARDDPLDQLREAASLKGELDELTDGLLGHFVDQARRAGSSWSQIGEALGVTKQAAQQRHASVEAAARRLLAPIAPEWSGGGGFLTQFTPRARACIVGAQRAASELGHAFIGTEHLLLGLFAQPEAIAGRILAEHGIEREAVEGAIRAQVRPGDGPVVDEPMPFTPQAKQALEEALRAALDLFHNYLGTEHLLLGLLRVPDALAATVLHEAGLDHAAARADVVRLLSAG